ncbi:MAG: PAS domain S-box protein [Chloroflexi bacterium]|nr:PAS domain S-box protein [Chloroflexota bacterium]
MNNQTPRILIVDDDPNMLGTVSDIFKLKGFEPVSALTDSDALAQVQKHHIDVALIDLRLGKASGLDVLKNIKALSPETECILLTGHATQDSAIDAVQLGAFGYFQKPFDMGQMLLSIQRAVEKQITQHALHDSEERYRALTEQIPAIIYLEDATRKAGHTLYISPQVETILGITPEEWMRAGADPWVDHIHPDDLERVATEYDLKCFQNGEAFDCEYRMIASDKRIVWIRDEAKTLLDEQGKPHLIHGIMHDITDRKQAEQALKQSEARFHALIRNAADLIVVINPKGVILYTSPSSERILGYSPQESLGRNFLEWVHPEDMHIALSSLASRAKIPGTAQESVEVRSLHKNGTWRVIEVLGTNLLEEPAVQGIVLNMRDVTERKYAEETVRKREERFRALIEHSADVIALLDANGVVLYESPTARRIMKFQGEGRVGASIFDLLVDTDLQPHREFFEKILKHPNLSMDTVFRYWRSDGAIYWAEATLTNLLNEPNVNAIVVNYRDITERKQAEEALHHSEQRYRGLFEDTPIAIWEEDFSEIKKYLDSLKEQGVTDFQEYFSLHPDAASECSSMIKVLDVNNTAVQMFRAESKEVLIEHTNSGISKGEAEHNHEDFIAIAEGKFSNSWEGADETLAGEPIEISLSWSVAPGYEDDYSKVMVTTLDITERRKAEEARRESEKRYHELFEDSPIALVEEDFSAVKQLLDALRQEGVSDFHAYLALHPEIVAECAEKVKIKEVNKAALRMYRADSKNKMPSNLTEILRGKAIENFGSQLAAIANGQAEFSWEGINHAIDGSQLDVDVNWSAASGYEKDLSKVIVSLQDITERRRTEEALRDNEVRYRMLFENAPVGIFSADAQGKIIEVNSVALQILGSPSAEATKSINLLTFPPLVTAGFSADFKNCAEKRQSIFAEFSYTSNWGKSILAQYHLTPILGENGQISQIQIILEDITERRQAEEALRDREASLQAVLQSTADGILAVNSENKVLYANERFAEMWLIPQSVLATKEDSTLLQYILDQLIDPQGFLRKVQELYKSDGESFDTLYFKDGRVFERLSRPMLEGTNVRGRVWSFRDITERRRSEEGLRRAEEKYRNIFENSIEGMFQSTPAGKFITVNSALARMWGYDSPEDLITTVTDIARQIYAVPEVRAEHQRLIREQGGNLSGFEYQAYRKDGSVIWVLESVRSVYDADGDLLYYEGTIEDISTRKQAEEAVRESEEKYRLLVENAGEALYVLQNGLVVFVNPMFEKIAGLPASELIGTSILEFIPEPKDRFSAIKNHQRLLRGKIENAQWEIKARLRSGMERWINVSEVRTTWKGEPATLNYATDITEHRQAEEALRNAGSYNRRLIEASIDPLVTIGPDGKITDVNRATEEVTGVPRKSLIGSDFSDYFTEPERARNGYEQVLAQGMVKDYPLTIHHAGGKMTDVLYNATVYENADGKVEGVFAAARDITQRKQADEAINQRVVELGLLYESGLAFSQLLNPKEIAKKIINLLEQKMDWHHTAIRLYDPETKTLNLLAFNQPNLINVEEITAAEKQLKTRVARLDQGLSGWVVQHGQTVRTNDLANDNRYVESLPGMQSGLYVPIKLGEHVIGVISIESEVSNAFSEADERLADTLANQAASALENARLFDETRQRIMELTALHHTGQTLLAARLNPEQIYSAVHEAVAQTMPCEAFVIVLDDDDHRDYHAIYFFDKGERFPPRRLPREKGLSGSVISSGKTILIDDIVETPVQAIHFGSRESVRSILAVPLRRGDTITGMLSTQSYQPHVFGESQRVMLETISAQLSSALENAHLYQQTQARINELETLHVISTSLRTIQNTNEALSTILDNILATLETDAGSILLYDPSSNELHNVVARGWFEELAATPIKAGEGVAGTVFASGEPYYSAEFISASLLHVSTRSRIPMGWGGVCLPIRTSTEIIGVMFVSVQLPRQISSQQIRLLESLVDMAGAALQRMRLHNETARRAEEFATLYETSKVLSAEYDLVSLLKVIVNGAKSMLQASTSGMYLYHADSQELELMMETSPSLPIGTRLQFGEGAAGKVAQTRLPLRIDNYSTWEGRSPKYANVSIGAVIEVPMLYGGELIGVLTADEDEKSIRKFTEADERLLSLFASQAAGAINSARHHEDTIRYAEELEERVLERTAEIENTRQRLDLAASAGGIGVWEVNLKDYTVFWDNRMHMIHGTGTADFDNSLDSWWKMLHPEDVKRSQVQFKTALQKTGLFMDEYRILHPDGSVRHIAANAIVLYNERHRPERMIGVNMDITERKQAEEAMHLANLEMERALRTKDEFLANMSHELRTPLNAILGISESLEEQFAGPLNEKQLKYTGIIRESGRHLLELINDILDISKIEAGRMELDVQNLSVEKICQASLRMVKELAQKKEQKVSFEIKGDVKTILGDERRLKQSLVNLLGNAVKFTSPGGSVGLEVNGHADANEVTFTVWDTGVGIAESDIQYLFKPFVQLDSGLSREYQGTGLGLALVAQMIRLHGGRVHVESVLGRGSRFIITLPWMSEQQNARVKKTGELPPLSLKSGKMRKGKILLVEDTSVVITLMSEYLDFKGYKVLVARNGVEGVQLAKQEHPDLILMDVMMPVMDGLEATRQIRTDRSMKNVPIIALTALAMAGDREICLAAGMTDYMSKPIKMQELADIIEKYLGTDEQAAQAG